jgi:hypothetical protein
MPRRPDVLLGLLAHESSAGKKPPSLCPEGKKKLVAVIFIPSELLHV